MYFDPSYQKLILEEELNLKVVSEKGQGVINQIKKTLSRPLTIDFSAVNLLDSSGVVFIHQVERLCKDRDITCKRTGISTSIAKTLSIFAVPASPLPIQEEKIPFPEQVGERAIAFYNNFVKKYINLMADMAFWTMSGIFYRKAQRKNEVVNQSILIGVNALPLIALISFLFGLVLTIQLAAMARPYGAGLFLANAIVFVFTAELGPLLTAIMIAGRSGSAIASELASMKVSEELDALNTMGINPIQYLIVPKMQASIITMPLIAILADIAGILGGVIVVYFYLDISPVTFYNSMVETLRLQDILNGIIKSLVFAGLIVQTSSFYGLQVRGGAVGVGKYTTKAVVTSIFLVILADSFLGLLFY